MSEAQLIPAPAVRSQGQVIDPALVQRSPVTRISDPSNPVEDSEESDDPNQKVEASKPEVTPNMVQAMVAAA